MEGASALAILTPWNQFRNLDLKKVKELLALPLFFDLRNIYDRRDVEDAGLRYFSVGR
jgi:UDPglucose 6-dehydrogenase